MSKDTEIRVPVLTRVEGEGALDISIHNGAIADIKLRIFEPPRLFEKLLEGRSWREVPDIVARICGICPVAYQMSAVAALESIFQLEPSPWVQAMRRVMYCGEWLESHSLHIHLLAAPDFLGFDSGPAMAKQYPEELKRGLRLQGLGNDILRLLGGRSVHPVGVRVGGFSRAPDVADVTALRQRIEDSLPEAEALIAWTANLPLPDDEQKFTSVALRLPDQYAVIGGRLVSDQGLDIPISDYEHHFQEFHAPHSTALHASLHGQPYLVGPLARLNLNLDRLPPELSAILTRTGITFPSRNMFHSIVARAVEIWLALFEAVQLLSNYQPDMPYVEPKLQAGIGFGCTEAPRGILWHHYEVDAEGRVLQARIVPPTSQNQPRIEEDLRLSLTRFGLERSDDELRKHGEMVIRNYDPCISCATHFLKFRSTRQ